MTNFIQKLDNQENQIVRFSQKRQAYAPEARFKKRKPRAQKFLDFFESQDKKSVTISNSNANPSKKFANSLFKNQNLQKPVYTSYSKNDEVKLVTIGLASANRIRQWAEKTLPDGKIIGEVTNANTLHHKTFKPQKGGLFCERIFGPLKDFQCACTNSKRIIPQKALFSKGSASGAKLLNFETEGDSKNPNLVINNTSLGLLNNYKRFFCSKCDVEYTWSVIRRYQLGYIKLNAPVTHVWYVKGNPSYISLLLDMKKKHVEYVTYCTETLTLENSLKGDQFYTVSDSPSDIFAAWQKVIQSSATNSGDITINPQGFAQTDKSENFMQEKITKEISFFNQTTNRSKIQNPVSLSNVISSSIHAEGADSKDNKVYKKNSYYFNLYASSQRYFDLKTSFLDQNHAVGAEITKNIMDVSDSRNTKFSEKVVPKTQPSQSPETIDPQKVLSNEAPPTLNSFRIAGGANSKLIKKYQIIFEQSALTGINPPFKIQTNRSNTKFLKPLIPGSGTTANDYGILDAHPRILATPESKVLKVRQTENAYTEAHRSDKKNKYYSLKVLLAGGANIKTKTLKIRNREYDLDSLTNLRLTQILPFFYREYANILNLDVLIRFESLFSIASKNKIKTAIEKFSLEPNAFFLKKAPEASNNKYLSISARDADSVLYLCYLTILLQIQKTELSAKRKGSILFFLKNKVFLEKINVNSSVISVPSAQIQNGSFKKAFSLSNKKSLVSNAPPALKQINKIKQNLLIKLVTNLLNSTLESNQEKDIFTCVQINYFEKRNINEIFNSFEIHKNLSSFYLMRLLYILKKRDLAFNDRLRKTAFIRKNKVFSNKNKKHIWNNILNSFQKYFYKEKNNIPAEGAYSFSKNFLSIMAHLFSDLSFQQLDKKKIGGNLSTHTKDTQGFIKINYATAHKDFLAQFSLKNLFLVEGQKDITNYYKSFIKYQNQKLKKSLFINKFILFIKKQLNNFSVVSQNPLALIDRGTAFFPGANININNTNIFTKSELNVLKLFRNTFGFNLNQTDGMFDFNTSFYKKYNLNSLNTNKLEKQYINNKSNNNLMLFVVISSTKAQRQTKGLSQNLSYVEAIIKKVAMEFDTLAKINSNRRRLQTKTLQKIVKTLRKSFVDISNNTHVFNMDNILSNKNITLKLPVILMATAYDVNTLYSKQNIIVDPGFLTLNAKKIQVFPAYRFSEDKKTAPPARTSQNKKGFVNNNQEKFLMAGNLSKETYNAFGTKIVNNIYCLSHRELWAQERDWHFFALYYFSTPNIDDLVIPIYSHRTYDFSLLNTLFTKENKISVNRPGGTYHDQRSISAYGANSNMYYLNQEQEKQYLNVSFSGAGMIQTLLKELDYFEMKKIDKQNRILLYDLNKYIRKLKKSLWSASIGNGNINLFDAPPVIRASGANNTRTRTESAQGNTKQKKNKYPIFQTLFPGTTFKKYYTFIQKLLRETCSQRDALIRRTKLIRKVFKNANNKNLLEENTNLYNSKNTNTGQHIDKFGKDKHLLQGQSNLQAFGVSGHLTSMVLTVLPVLPPDLRPIVKMGNQIAASDLNRLYQRVIYRNDRLKKFLKDATTNGSYEMKYAQRLLQEAVDNLIQNGKSGVVPEKDARGRALKSLSDLLKGKQGRFRQYLLGKRVDYSGRSVIVVGPKLKLHECGIPKEMALELYLPFLIKSILNQNFARTVVGAKALIQNNKPLTWSLLREIMKTCPVLLNRAPTLHRLGFQAFQPKLVDGRAILLHPLVCPAFNADFDGDQMAVHVPISAEARAEAWKLMLSRNNLLSPATGEPLVLPSQDMVLGCYYLTTNSNIRTQKYEKGYGQFFESLNDVLRAYSQGIITTHTIVWIKWNGHIENTNDLEQPLEIRINRYGFSHLIYSKSQTIFSIRAFGANNPQTIFVNKIIKTTPGKILFNVLINSSYK